jgi:hypothetical protein
MIIYVNIWVWFLTTTVQQLSSYTGYIHNVRVVLPRMICQVHVAIMFVSDFRVRVLCGAGSQAPALTKLETEATHRQLHKSYGG